MSVSDAWPRSRPGEIDVLLLGTYHMDNPGLDEVNVDADDVLCAHRQRELERLADALVSFDPDRVTVERPQDRADALNDVYDAYRRGENDYGEEVEFEPRHPERDDPATACRSEVVQVGFRVADRLGHDAVYPVDSPTSMANEDVAALEDAGFEPERKTDVAVTDLDAYQREVDERLLDSTIPAYLRWLNAEERLAVNHEVMFDRYLRFGEGDNFGGPDALATWYRRNLRMAHDVWRAVEAGDERVLLVVGSGHVRALRHLFRESPSFCPRSALPHLDAAVE